MSFEGVEEEHPRAGALRGVRRPGAERRTDEGGRGRGKSPWKTQWGKGRGKDQKRHVELKPRSPTPRKEAMKE